MTVDETGVDETGVDIRIQLSKNNTILQENSFQS